jgi:large subunit ribosomal protein L18
MKRKKTGYHARKRRHLRVRKRVEGTPQMPRLAVYRSLTHIYAQLIDDEAGRTLAAASDMEADLRGQANGKRKTEVAKLVGGLVGKRATEQGIRRVVFDRGGYKYHGRVRALADGAREAGLQF